ncbi:MAG: hypothetical protein ACLFVW_04340 [Phycisphaerae bacterium]
MRWFVKLTVMTLILAVAGCRRPVGLTELSTGEPARDAGAVAAFDSTDDDKADFFGFADADGRIRYIGYDTTDDGTPNVRVDLDAVPLAQCRHLVIVLDGVSYDPLKDYYESGGLRMFHPPSRVIAPYPTMTDLCMIDLLDAPAAEGVEARYYGRRSGKMVGGSMEYLSGGSKGYNRILQYRAGLLWDALGYLKPRAVFGKEMNDLKETFDAGETREIIAYFASSAGMGTRLSEQGHRECLETVERLVWQVLCETRGLAKVTLLADHGHNYTASTPIELESFLKERGWRMTDRLGDGKDVAYIRFGLETYAGFATNRPAELGGDVIECDGVTLASFAEDDYVVVLAPDGQRARVHRRDNSYRYEPVSGDPLKLNELLAAMEPEDGYHDADELLEATAEHYYPAPLQRLWRAHFAMVQNPPDVIISLAADKFSGAKYMANAIDVASTHGSLRRKNTVTFIMSTVAPLPELMRSSEVPGHMSDLLGEHWPTGQ